MSKDAYLSSSSPVAASHQPPNSKRIRTQKDLDIIMQAEAVLSRPKVARARRLQEAEMDYQQEERQQQQQQQQQQQEQSPDHHHTSLVTYKDVDEENMPKLFTTDGIGSSSNGSNSLIYTDGAQDLEGDSTMLLEDSFLAGRIHLNANLTVEEEMEMRSSDWLRTAKSPSPPPQFNFTGKDRDDGHSAFDNDQMRELMMLSPPGAPKKSRHHTSRSENVIFTAVKKNQEKSSPASPQTPMLGRLNLIDPGATPFNPRNWNLPTPLKPIVSRPFQSRGTIYTIDDSVTAADNTISTDEGAQGTGEPEVKLLDVACDTLRRGAEATAGVHPNLSRIVLCFVVALFAYVLGRFFFESSESSF